MTVEMTGWMETDAAVLACLQEAETMSPTELADRLGISEGEATAFLCMLAREGKVRLRLVEHAGRPEHALTDR